MLNTIRFELYNNLKVKASQTLYKKLEATNQGFSYALMLNNNTEYQEAQQDHSNGVISLATLQDRLHIAQNNGDN